MYRIMIVFVLSIMLVACDNILDTNSNSTFTEETSFSNYDFAKKAVAGIYFNFTASNMHANDLIFYKLGSDIEHRTGTPDGARISLAQYAADDGNTLVANSWNRFYQGIERANICIENLPKSPMWENEFAEQAQALYAEAVALRAFCYYELISFWGDIPFKTRSTQAGDNFYLPKTERDEIYEFLIQDLKDAEAYAPWMSGSAENITKGFIKGLRARMAMAYAGYSLRNKAEGFVTRRGRNWQEYYKIANQECRELMESGRHRLNPSYIGIFKLLHAYSQDITNKEVLWEIAFGRGYSGRFGQMIGMQFTTNPAEPKYGRAAAEPTVPLNYFYSFDRQDLRRNVNVELYNYGDANNLSKQRMASVTSLRPCKWRRSWIVPSMGGDLATVQVTGVNFPVMRYTDVVLLFAETENEINGAPTTDAKNALASIRQRAFPQELWSEKVSRYVDSVSVSKEAFFNALVDERMWEFGGELIRKFDLVRWNLLGEKLDKMKSDISKIIDNDPEFNWVPDRIYWKQGDDGETIDILNPDYRWTGAAPAGYSNSTWGSGLSESSKTSARNYANQCVSGYNRGKNNHLFPLNQAIMNASNNVLQNDLIP